jgi:general secretion pathway protein I
VTGRRGFTLLELIVASAIMAIAVVGLMAGLSGAARNATRLRDYDRAVQLAQLRMNELLLDDRLPRNAEVNGLFDASLAGGVESGWRARLSAFEMPPYLAPGQMALYRIQLEVWWTVGGQKRTLTLDGFKRRVLKAEDIPSVVVAP